MKNWTEIIEANHAWDHPEGENELVLAPPATELDLTNAEEKLSIQFPREFRELYLTHNGFGFTNKDNELTWSFIPLDEFPSFVQRIRSWFDDEKPQLAKRFFPFFDWLDGGGCGYFLSTTGKIERKLYDFHPEQLSDSFDCGPSSPLDRGPYSSIEAFLSDR